MENMNCYLVRCHLEKLLLEKQNPYELNIYIRAEKKK